MNAGLLLSSNLIFCRGIRYRDWLCKGTAWLTVGIPPDVAEVMTESATSLSMVTVVLVSFLTCLCLCSPLEHSLPS